jgi:hypothetical protein
MKKLFYILTLLIVLTNCKNTDENKVAACCDKTYTNADDALNCFSRTNDGKGTSADERLLLIAFVNKDVEANQKLGWNLIRDPEIIKEAKRKYALVIADVNQFKIPDNDCASYMLESIRKNSGKPFFVIANQAQCWCGEWTPDDGKEGIIQRLGEGNGP